MPRYLKVWKKEIEKANLHKVMHAYWNARLCTRLLEL